MQPYSKFIIFSIETNKICKEKNYVQKGDMVINLASMPIANKGMVNTLRISDIE